MKVQQPNIIIVPSLVPGTKKQKGFSAKAENPFFVAFSISIKLREVSLVSLQGDCHLNILSPELSAANCVS